MEDNQKTQEQLFAELQELRKRNAEYEIQKKELIKVIEGLEKAETEFKRSDKLLREREERYHSVYSTSAVSFWEYDITNVMQYMEKLKSEGISNLRSYFKDNPVVAKKLLSSQKLLDVNDATLKMYGATTKEELFAAFGKHTTPESMDSFIESITACMEGDEYLESETINHTLDGRHINLLLRVSFPEIYQKKRMLIAVVDITERKQAENLQRNLQKVRDKIWAMRTPDDIKEVASTIRKSLATLDVDFFGFGMNIINPSDDPLIVTVYEIPQDGVWICESGAAGEQIILDIWRKGLTNYRKNIGAEDVYKESGYLAKIFDGQIMSVIDVPFSHGTLAVNSEKSEAFSEYDIKILEEMAQVLSEGFKRSEDLTRLEKYTKELENDVTERKKAEIALRESLKTSADLMYSIPFGIFIYQYENPGNLILISGNPEAERLTGIKIDDWIGKEINEIWPEASKTGVTDSFLKVIETGTIFESEDLYYNDGKLEGAFRIRAFLLPGERLCVSFENITERKKADKEKTKLEEHFRQAQKVESIGRLAGGMAHDLNNLLVPIIGFAELLGDEFDPDDERRESADEIVRAGFRARDLVQQLLAFSRKQMLQFKTLDMNKIIREFEKLLRRTIREDIAIEIIPSTDIRTIRADIGQIEQVIMNLSVNAQDAMPEGGKLTIETAMVKLDESYTADHPGTETGEYVMLAISDTGCGMDEETRKLIFEPFYSTKGELGTGLGLATVYGIVKQHGGNIWVYSEPGMGTTFKVYLPASEKKNIEKSAREESCRDRRGTETIMLVEDNEQVRLLASAILKKRGYTILVAENGIEALTILEEHHGSVQLLLTDVIMPGMNGRDLYAKASDKHPGLKVLFMSGYTENMIAHHGILDEGVQFIQKPFSAHALAALVRELLDYE